MVFDIARPVGWLEATPDMDVNDEYGQSRTRDASLCSTGLKCT
jgi:hypothetical protein